MMFHRLNPRSTVLLYINDLPKIPTNETKIISYDDDTSIIASNPSSQYFKININEVFVDIIEWCKTNVLVLS
jgi:hypothetical protein